MPKVPTKKQPKGDVKYPKVKFVMMDGDTPMTEDIVKEILGWCEDEEKAMKAGFSAPLFKFKDYRDEGKTKKVWCLNNVKNRPFYGDNMLSLVQKMLNSQWAGPNGAGGTLNPEPMIVSEYGRVQNGQHCGVALVLANNELFGPHAAHWVNFWPNGQVVIDKVVVYGISESDKVVNTMDTCKPRSLSDIIYRSEYFEKMDDKKRRTASKMMEQAIKTLWHRLGLKSNPWKSRRVHEEATAFIDRHPRLLKCVKHILSENEGNPLGKYIPPGYAAGLMYLMAVSGTDSEEYHAQEEPSEKFVDFSKWDKAEEFWTLMINGHSLEVIRYAIGHLGDATTGVEPRLIEREAVILKGWNLFSEGEDITPDDLSIEDDYHTDEDTGVRKFDKVYTCGGIDLGGPQNVPHPEDQDDAEEFNKVTGYVDDGSYDGDEPPPAAIPKPKNKKKK